MCKENESKVCTQNNTIITHKMRRCFKMLMKISGKNLLLTLKK